MKYLVVDIEANGLVYDATDIHCIVVKDHHGSVWKYYDIVAYPSLAANCDGSIAHCIAMIKKALYNGYTIIGHNICNFDIPLLEAFKYNLIIPKGQLIDTMLLSCLMEPETPHSLDFYGRRLGVHAKVSNDDWSVLTDHMLHRCEEDVHLTEVVYNYFSKKYTLGDWQSAIELENKIAYIHACQSNHGIRVDLVKAGAILKELDFLRSVLEYELHNELPMTVTQGTHVTKPFKLNGSLTAQVTKWFDKADVTALTEDTVPLVSANVKNYKKAVRVMGEFSKVEFSPLNLNSHPKVKEILLELGWQPTEWNYKKDPRGGFLRDSNNQLIKTSPKLTEDSYNSLPPGVGSKLAEFLMLCHRRRYLLNDNDLSKGALPQVRRPEGRAPAEGFTCGTNTGRYRHFGVMTNIPKPSSPWGVELRSIFTVPDGHLMLGIDLSGIEARVMAHYAFGYDGGAYAAVVLNSDGTEKDIHQENANILGVSRDRAKSFLYAISYGAGKAKLANVLGVSVPQAAVLIDKYWNTHSGLRDLKEALEDEHSRGGCIEGLDGRKLVIRSQHKLLNTLIQSAATIIFKKWMVKVDKFLQGYNRSGEPECHQILAYHDELEFEYYGDNVDDARVLCRVMVDLIDETAKEMGIRVPLTGDFKVGKSFDQVH